MLTGLMCRAFFSWCGSLAQWWEHLSAPTELFQKSRLRDVLMVTFALQTCTTQLKPATDQQLQNTYEIFNWLFISQGIYLILHKTPSPMASCTGTRRSAHTDRCHGDPWSSAPDVCKYSSHLPTKRFERLISLHSGTFHPCRQ